MIEQLPLLTPDPARAQTVLERCHNQLTQQRRRVDPVARPGTKGMLTIKRAIVATLCAAYLSSVARDVARLLDR
jgi:hypothetical protein